MEKMEKIHALVLARRYRPHGEANDQPTHRDQAIRYLTTAKALRRRTPKGIRVRSHDIRRCLKRNVGRHSDSAEKWNNHPGDRRSAQQIRGTTESRVPRDYAEEKASKILRGSGCRAHRGQKTAKVGNEGNSQAEGIERESYS